MKRIGIYLVSLVLFFNNSLLAYSTNPKDFVNELVNDAISKLSDKNLNEDQKKTFTVGVYFSFHPPPLFNRHLLDM